MPYQKKVAHAGTPPTEIPTDEPVIDIPTKPVVEQVAPDEPKVDMPPKPAVKHAGPVILVENILDVRFKDKDGSLYRLEPGRVRGLYTLYPTKE